VNTNTTNTAKHWLAGFVTAAGLGAAIFTGNCVASADTGTATTNGISVALGSPSGTTTDQVNDGVSSRKLQEGAGAKVPGAKVHTSFTMPTETITAKPPQPK